MRAFSRRFEFGEALEGGLGDAAKGMICEKCLMAGDKDVGKGEEPGKNVILQNLRRAILKEEASLLLVDIDGEVANMPFL